MYYVHRFWIRLCFFDSRTDPATRSGSLWLDAALAPWFNDPALGRCCVRCLPSFGVERSTDRCLEGRGFESSGGLEDGERQRQADTPSAADTADTADTADNVQVRHDNAHVHPGRVGHAD